jgi:bacteriorhodopsin
MTSFLEVRGNDALNVNPPNADRYLTVNGSNWLWAVFAVYTLCFLAWLLWCLSLWRSATGTTTRHGDKVVNIGAVAATMAGAPRGERIFHYLFTIAAFIGLIAYFTMASDLGNTPISQYMNTGYSYEGASTTTGAYAPITRSVFYVRYIFWALAWPLVLIAVLLISGLPWATILFAVGLLEIWTVSWLSGAVTHSSYKWGYFVFGLFAELILIYLLHHWGNSESRTFGATKSFATLAGILALVWLIYPISWGLSEGGNRLSVTGEMVFYGILDLLAIPGFGTLFLIMSRRFDHGALFDFTGHGRHSGRALGYGAANTGYAHTTGYNTANTGYAAAAEPAAVQSGV